MFLGYLSKSFKIVYKNTQFDVVKIHNYKFTLVFNLYALSLSLSFVYQTKKYADVIIPRGSNNKSTYEG